VVVGLPGINGLDLIAQIHSFAPEVSFIIITSHDDFGFAQRAIKLGVEDYLLKPVKPDALKKAISASITKRELRNEENMMKTTLIDRMETIKPFMENDFIYTIVTNGHVETLQRLLSFFGWEDQCGICIVVTEQNKTQMFAEQLHTALRSEGKTFIGGVFNNQAELCFLFDGEKTDASAVNNLVDDMVNAVVKKLKTLGCTNFHLGVSKPVYTIAGWFDAFRQAGFALKVAESERTPIKKYEALSGLREDAAMEQRKTGTGLFGQLKQFSLAAPGPRDYNTNIFIDQAVRYIKSNYQNEISLGNIADQIPVSPYYLAKLFRRHTGKTCTEVIAEERIEAAKKLLVQNRSSKETCYEVGFNSQNYFAKIFKKYTGLTPSEYRNANAGVIEP
jgi:two-component system response regulator YesN